LHEGIRVTRDGQAVVGIVVALKRDPNLPQVIAAVHAPRRFTSCLDGGQEHPCQDANDSDHNEQLDERDSTLFVHCMILAN
jgi:hypothetical protein